MNHHKKQNVHSPIKSTRQSKVKEFCCELIGSAVGEIVGYILFGSLLMGGVWAIISISIWVLLGLLLMMIPAWYWLYQKIKNK